MFLNLSSTLFTVVRQLRFIVAGPPTCRIPLLHVSMIRITNPKLF